VLDTLTACPFSDCFGFDAADDANFLWKGLPRGQVFDVPDLTGGLIPGESMLRAGREQGANINQEIPSFVFQHHDGMLVMPTEQLEYTRLGVKPIAQQDVETAGVCLDDALDQSHGGGALILMRSQHFKVEEEAKTRPHQLEDHGPMIILYPFLPIDDQLPRLAMFAATIITADFLISA